ncbi:MAG TPA: serine hydrolase domain-containing protein [Steroidobacteraceae bacterium]|jgi:D-alanyl-D-alanine carboxypeptidase|nr:serine hydrolase domain-containing protein [Steroidobacteraceae bacterium]
MKFAVRLLTIGFIAASSALSAAALDEQRVAQIVGTELSKLEVPSASVAIVLDGRIAYAKAFGKAQLDPDRAATDGARYEIGSISKQFLATAVLMLQEEGKLSLEDRAGKYLPELGPAANVTLRQLLSHTAGIRDYWPQDYVFTRMLTPISHEELLRRWAAQPLDFPPGEQWQYSNTGYTVAGMMAERAADESLFAFLQRRIFGPLHMSSVVNADEEPLGPADAVGYTRAALGPLHRAPHEGKGWLFAAGELAMTAADLARWDVSVIDASLMHPASYRQLETETLLNDGVGTQYALGIGVRMTSERRTLIHSGGTSGFITRNVIYPDQRAAIVVLTNSDAADAAAVITDKLQRVVFESVSPVDTARRDEARRIFDGLRQGGLDRSLLSANANAYFTAETVQEIARSIAPLGAVKSFELVKSGTRGGMDFRVYAITLEKRELFLVARSLPDGKLEQYLIGAN